MCYTNNYLGNMTYEGSDYNFHIGHLVYLHWQSIGAYQILFNVLYCCTAQYIDILVYIEATIEVRLLSIPLSVRTLAP